MERIGTSLIRCTEIGWSDRSLGLKVTYWPSPSQNPSEREMKPLLESILVPTGLSHEDRKTLATSLIRSSLLSSAELEMTTSLRPWETPIEPSSMSNPLMTLLWSI